ncbi:MULTISPECIES: LLM class flavin-dependent oxidoreductase [unclassified Streptomyces]|uniref:LLM class flavin-dependent oxidoreductase n=1 Tax=unclassified Streptomyces TaxID=2593676 RepID=UPI000F4E10D0|nr:MULTISPECIES: LLM class flavin-dependent oxidoreductase [unclassified Streptomyces]MDH6453709.1 F420-dependent oxidoreductase-like protein [Streptomyces sp. SAI-119]MDH6495733.1 F420-dependent oxidoreductase-like protein [Streptomyces sp. SAI-149]QUC57372.1 LLM class flavin-dependent oxidoreductase [Streptomyces sp. A2-16]
MRLGAYFTYDEAAWTAPVAEELGYELGLVAEGYVTEAAVALGAAASRTTRLQLASGVFEIPARTPVLTAMTAATLDAVSAGRFTLGLGVANAQVSEGWHGVPFDRPLARTREYLDVVRLTLSGSPVSHRGEHFPLAPPGGPWAPFTLRVPGARPDLPIHLAAVGPRNVELAGEVADGWIGNFCPPDRVAENLRRLETGRRRAGRDGLADFDVLLSVPAVVADDPREAAEPVRRYVSRFVSLGRGTGNFYYAHLARLGLGEAAEAVQERFLAGDPAGAAAAVPFDFVDRIALLGPPERIAERLRAYDKAGVTTLAVSPLSPTSEERARTLTGVAAARRLAGL